MCVGAPQLAMLVEGLSRWPRRHGSDRGIDAMGRAIVASMASIASAGHRRPMLPRRWQSSGARGKTGAIACPRERPGARGGGTALPRPHYPLRLAW
jgi:hypothetical protein